jgi:dehydrogenase/reductase SDR family member 12
MPSTTETTTIDRPASEVFPRVADFAHLSEWDPVFDSSSRLDDGPVGVGSSFLVTGTTAGREVELILTITTYDAPNLVTLRRHRRRTAHHRADRGGPARRRAAAR